MNKEYINRARQETNKHKLDVKSNIESILSVVFSFIAAIFGAIIASGFDFSVDTFTNPVFYITTIISFGIMMFVYNFVKRVALKNLKSNKETEYYKSKNREDRLIKYVRDNHLEESVIEIAAARETEANRRTAAQNLIDNITYGLSLNEIEDIENEDNIAINQEKFNLFVRKRGLKKKEIKKLRKAINKVLNGRYSYDIITAHDVLVDTSLDPKHARQIKVNERKLDRAENRRKAITFIISTALTNSLIWDGISDRFWTSLLTQIVLILTSSISAFTVAYSRLNTLVLISSNKCDFFNQALKDNLTEKPLGTDIGS